MTCRRPLPSSDGDKEFRAFRNTRSDYGDHLANHCWWNIEGRYEAVSYSPPLVLPEENYWRCLFKLLRGLADSGDYVKDRELPFIIEMLYFTSLMHFTSAVESWRHLSNLCKAPPTCNEYPHFTAQTLVTSALVSLSSSLDVISHMLYCLDGELGRLNESVPHGQPGKLGRCRTGKEPNYKKLDTLLNEKALSPQLGKFLNISFCVNDALYKSLKNSLMQLRNAHIHGMFVYVVPIKKDESISWYMLKRNLDFSEVINARRLSTKESGGWTKVMEEYPCYFEKDIYKRPITAPELLRDLLAKANAFVGAVCGFIEKKHPEPG